MFPDAIFQCLFLAACVFSSPPVSFPRRLCTFLAAKCLFLAACVPYSPLSAFPSPPGFSQLEFNTMTGRDRDSARSPPAGGAASGCLRPHVRAGSIQQEYLQTIVEMIVQGNSAMHTVTRGIEQVLFNARLINTMVLLSAH